MQYTERPITLEDLRAGAVKRGNRVRYEFLDLEVNGVFNECIIEGPYINSMVKISGSWFGLSSVTKLYLIAEAAPPDPKHPHIIDGEFQSDKYPTTPRGKVPLSVKDKTAQDLLWTYAQRRRAVDAEFATDLETCLIAAGYAPVPPRRMLPREINALPARVRSYIHDLETMCDPAGLVRDAAFARENAEALAARVRELEEMIQIDMVAPARGEKLHTRSDAIAIILCSAEILMACRSRFSQVTDEGSASIDMLTNAGTDLARCANEARDQMAADHAAEERAFEAQQAAEENNE